MKMISLALPLLAAAPTLPQNSEPLRDSIPSGYGQNAGATAPFTFLPEVFA